MANVIIQTAFLGDVLLSFPLIRRLKKIEPNQQVILICRAGLGASLKKLGLADDVWEWDKSNSSSEVHLHEKILKIKINKLIVPHRSFRTGIFVSKILAQQKIGFKTFWNKLFFHKRVSYNQQLPDALRQLSLLSAFDETVEKEIFNFVQNIEEFNPANRSDHLFSSVIKKNSLDMALSSASIDDVKTLKIDSPEWLEIANGSHKPMIAISPGSVWNTKRWTEDGFAQVCTELTNKGLTVLLLGSKAEVDICNRIASAAHGKSGKVINLSGRTSVSDMVSILKQCEAAITNDNGAMHLASLADIPVVSIFGPTVLSIGYRPWNDKAVVIQKDLNCRPCGKHGSHQCPIKTHACMKEVTVDQVIKGLALLKPNL